MDASTVEDTQLSFQRMEENGENINKKGLTLRIKFSPWFLKNPLFIAFPGPDLTVLS